MPSITRSHPPAGASCATRRRVGSSTRKPSIAPSHSPRRRRFVMARSFRFLHDKNDVTDEIGFHLDMRTREFIERGMSPDEARRAAAASFGDVAAIEAECRDERALRAREHARRDWLQGMSLDLRVALRCLWRRPAFTAASALTLTLGIGAAAAVFALVSGVLLRPLPYRDPSRLVMVWMAG